MTQAALLEIRDTLYRFLEEEGNDKHLYPDRAWAPTAKKLADKCAAELRKLFARQVKIYAARIPDKAGTIAEAEAPGWISAEVLTDDVTWQKELGDLILPFTSGGMKAGVEQTGKEFGFELAFDAGDEKVADIIKGRAIEFSKEVQQTTHDSVVKALADSADAGESIYEMKKKLAGLPEFDVYRSEMVARTEVVSAMNAGENESYGLMGAAGKKWVPAHDSRTRETHRRAAGQVVGVGEKFTVGGEKLEHPGDGSAANRINCRCRMTPVFDEEAVKQGKRSWNPATANSDWEDARKEKAAKLKARLDNQRKRQADLKAEREKARKGAKK